MGKTRSLMRGSNFKESLRYLQMCQILSKKVKKRLGSDFHFYFLLRVHTYGSRRGCNDMLCRAVPNIFLAGGQR